MEAAVIDKLAGWFDQFGYLAKSATKDQAFLVPPGTSLARAEAYATAPRFHRHHYSTERLADFINYTIAQKSLGSLNCATAYVLPDGSGARAVFDHGDPAHPEWGHHSATLKFKHTPAWVAAAGMVSGTRTQQQVIDWLEDWAPDITAHAQDGDQAALEALDDLALEGTARFLRCPSSSPNSPRPSPTGSPRPGSGRSRSMSDTSCVTAWTGRRRSRRWH